MDGPSHPLPVDGQIWASAMVVLESVRRGPSGAVEGRARRWGPSRGTASTGRGTGACPERKHRIHGPVV
jgi:hypothetical protein